MSLKSESKNKVKIGKRKVPTIRAMLPSATTNSISSSLEIPLLVRYIHIDRVK